MVSFSAYQGGGMTVDNNLDFSPFHPTPSYVLHQLLKLLAVHLSSNFLWYSWTVLGHGFPGQFDYI